MANKVYIYDCNNYVRIKSEKSFSGFFIRDLIDEANSGDELKFYVFDGANANSYRREFYPEYKMTRKPPLDNFFENLKWFKELLSYCKPNVCVVEQYGYEADDVMAELASWFDTVTIFSTDKDLLQIKNATLPMANNDWESRDFIFTRKVLCGDSSDNIKGLKGFGDTTWKSLSDYQKELARRWVESGSELAKFRFAEHLPTRAKNIILTTNTEDLDVFRKVIGFRKLDREKVKLNFGSNELDKLESKLDEVMI